MFSGYPEAFIILSPCTMTILKWPENTSFNCLNLNFKIKIKFWTYILNLNVEFQFWTWILNLKFEFEFCTRILYLNVEF